MNTLLHDKKKRTEWIENTRTEIRSKTGFQGEITIVISPYMMSDILWNFSVDHKILTVEIYSRDFPFCWEYWKKDFFRDIKNIIN